MLAAEGLRAVNMQSAGPLLRVELQNRACVRPNGFAVRKTSWIARRGNGLTTGNWADIWLRLICRIIYLSVTLAMYLSTRDHALTPHILRQWLVVLPLIECIAYSTPLHARNSSVSRD